MENTSNPIKVMCVFGTRPEAIKLAPVIGALQKSPQFDCQVVVTAQHREMLDQVLEIFDIHPLRDLNLMRPNQSLAESTAGILTSISAVYRELEPAWVLVQGDTTTVMTASLAAGYQRIKVGHVEAGLRTNDKWQPFPEEINRRITSQIADLHFAPTQDARRNLLREGFSDDTIVVTGNTAIDTLLMSLDRPLTARVEAVVSSLNGRKLVLVTAHRRENFGKPFEHIFEAIRELASKLKDSIEIVYPVHLNPNVHESAYTMLSGLDNVQLTEPLDYLSLIQLEKLAALIITDSGGIQEEATALGVPALVLRNTTERPEGVEAGVLKLVGSDKELILREAELLLTDPSARAKMAVPSSVYGDGRAADRIIEAILRYQTGHRAR